MKGGERVFKGIYVTPFPKNECVSSWTTTSTRVRSPVSNARAELGIGRRDVKYDAHTRCQESQTCVFLKFSN